MNCKLKLAFSSLLLSGLIASCGSILKKKDDSDGNTINLNGARKMTVSASVTNNSTQAVEVNLLNSGPHSGGCDDKSRVPFEVESHSSTTVSEDWFCTEDQWFYIEIKHPKTGIKVKSMTGKFICDDEACRQMDAP